MPPDPFETLSEATQVASLRFSLSLPPPLVHLLRLRTPLCMTGPLSITHTEATCISQTEKWLKWLECDLPRVQSPECLSWRRVLKVGGIQLYLPLWRMVDRKKLKGVCVCGGGDKSSLIRLWAFILHIYSLIRRGVAWSGCGVL